MSSGTFVEATSVRFPLCSFSFSASICSTCVHTWSSTLMSWLTMIDVTFVSEVR